MSLLVFADFTCPECYLAARRAELLVAAGVPVEWRAVEHRRELPVGGSAITSEAFDLIRGWRLQWAELGSPDLPAVLVDGATLHGPDAVRLLGKELGYAQAPLELPAAPCVDRARVRPDPTWTSRVGEPWSSTGRLTGR